jgi:hypothetical protein
MPNPNEDLISAACMLLDARDAIDKAQTALNAAKKRLDAAESNLVSMWPDRATLQQQPLLMLPVLFTLAEDYFDAPAGRRILVTRVLPL